MPLLTSVLYDYTGIYKQDDRGPAERDVRQSIVIDAEDGEESRCWICRRTFLRMPRTP